MRLLTTNLIIAFVWFCLFSSIGCTVVYVLPSDVSLSQHASFISTHCNGHHLDISANPKPHYTSSIVQALQSLPSLRMGDNETTTPQLTTVYLCSQRIEINSTIKWDNSWSNGIFIILIFGCA